MKIQSKSEMFGLLSFVFIFENSPNWRISAGEWGIFPWVQIIPAHRGVCTLTISSTVSLYFNFTQRKSIALYRGKIYRWAYMEQQYNREIICGGLDMSKTSREKNTKIDNVIFNKKRSEVKLSILNNYNKLNN